MTIDTHDFVAKLILGSFYEGPVPEPPELRKQADKLAESVIRIARAD